MAPYSKDELVNGYREGMHQVAGEMAFLVGSEHAANMALLTEDEMDEVELGGSSSTEVLKTNGARLVQEAYEFAFSGLLGDRLANEWEEGEGLTPWIGRFEGLNRFVSWEHGNAFSNCIHALRVANLRGVFSGSHAVDPHGMVWNCLLLPEFALLAGVGPKTIRNIASRKHRQHLPTTKLGKRTYVALTDALPWLEARGFPPSVYVNTEAKRDFNRRPFLSKQDLARFVGAQRERLGLSNEAIAIALAEIPEAAERLQALDASSTFVDETFADRLGRVLGISNPQLFASSAAALGTATKAQFPNAVNQHHKKRKG